MDPVTGFGELLLFMLLHPALKTKTNVSKGAPYTLNQQELNATVALLTQLSQVRRMHAVPIHKGRRMKR